MFPTSWKAADRVVDTFEGSPMKSAGGHVTVGCISVVVAPACQVEVRADGEWITGD